MFWMFGLLGCGLVFDMIVWRHVKILVKQLLIASVNSLKADIQAGLRSPEKSLNNTNLVNLTFDCDSSCRHLQRFWGASGDFWQDLWTKLYLKFEGHDAALFYFGKERQWVLDVLQEHFATSRLSFTVNNRAVFCQDKSRTMICFLNDSILNDLFCINTHYIHNTQTFWFLASNSLSNHAFRGNFHSSTMKYF